MSGTIFLHKGNRDRADSIVASQALEEGRTRYSGAALALRIAFNFCDRFIL